MIPHFVIIDELAEDCRVEPFRGGDDEDNLSHLFCCNPDIGLCGADLSDYRFDPDFDEDTPDMCRVCTLMSACTACGLVFPPRATL